MNYHKRELKKGINLHCISTDKFKTNLYSVFLTVPLTRETVTLNTLLIAVLRRGTKNMPSQDKISTKLEEMYGASFDCGVEKPGDNQVMKFYLETIHDDYLPEKENLLQESLSILMDVVFNPLLEKEIFKEEYVEGEKETIRQIIEGKIDDKAQYAQDRCTEIMYEGKPYGIYKYGYSQDLEKITAKELYQQYKNMLAQAKIDIFTSGNIKIEEIASILEKNNLVQELPQREPSYVQDSSSKTELDNTKTKKIEEKMNVAQGKLILGLTINKKNPEDRFASLLYNAILGGTANSKLFQNVREKAHLAYVAGSIYVRQKNIVFIKCGIEIENYDKAVDIIQKQLDSMKQGEFSEEEIENAKQQIIATIKSVCNAQAEEIVYYLGQELAGTSLSFEEYEKKVKKITKQQIVDIANSISINIIYFLKN